MSQSPSFYVLYPKDSKLKDTLNTLKVLSDDSQRTEAHITVRGPYFKRRLNKDDVKKYSEIVNNQRLTISQVDNFFGFGQNTVFFRCDDNEGLRKVWKKGNYGFEPHVTIYDGADSDFAKELFSILKEGFKPFYLEVEELDWLAPKNKTTPKLFSLKNRDQFGMFKDMHTSPITRNKIRTLTINQKLDCLKLVSQFLYSEFGNKLQNGSPNLKPLL